MNRILLPNLFFEEELSGQVAGRSPQAKRLVGELGPTMGLLAATDNAPGLAATAGTSQRTIVVVENNTRPGEVPPSLAAAEFRTIAEVAAMLRDGAESGIPVAGHWEGIAWGWSDAAVESLRKTGLHVKAPNHSVVRRINSREFQAQFDQANSSSCGDRIESFGTLCRTMPDVTTAIQRACEFAGLGWVIKANLSHAARNRLLGKMPVLSTSNRTWLEARFASGQVVYVEPWVERVAEWGLQFHVAEPNVAGPGIEFIGSAQLLTDKVGRYVGSIVRNGQEIHRAAIDHGFRIAESAAQFGYFGPLGIDCMCFRDRRNNNLWYRWSHDINGRLTMGRLALSLKNLAESREIAAWIHTVESRPLGNELQSAMHVNGEVRILPTSPGLIGDEAPRTRTFLVTSKNANRLRAVCSEILGQDLLLGSQSSSPLC